MLKKNILTKLALFISVISIITSTITFANNNLCAFTDDKNVIEKKVSFIGIKICKNVRSPQG